MDLRLDFYSALNKYAEKLSEDDSLLVLSYNRKDGDCITLLEGEWNDLSALLSTEGIVEHVNGSEVAFENIRKAVLNMALNICSTNKGHKEKLATALKALD